MSTSAANAVTMTEADLHEAFSRMGHVVSVHLCRCAVTGKGLEYGHINEYHHAEACLDSTYLKGKPMTKLGVGNLFIKNLDSSVTSMCLFSLFSHFGTVVSCKVADENGVSRGFGFIKFYTEESATVARTALHDTYFRGKKLFVSTFLKNIGRTANLYVKNPTEDAKKLSKFGKSLTYSTSTDSPQELNNGGQKTGHKLKGGRGGERAKSYSRGAPSGSLTIAASTLNKNKNNTGDGLQVSVGCSSSCQRLLGLIVAKCAKCLAIVQNLSQDIR